MWNACSSPLGVRNNLIDIDIEWWRIYCGDSLFVIVLPRPDLLTEHSTLCWASHQNILMCGAGATRLHRNHLGRKAGLIFFILSLFGRMGRSEICMALPWREFRVWSMIRSFFSVYMTAFRQWGLGWWETPTVYHLKSHTRYRPEVFGFFYRIRLSVAQRMPSSRWNRLVIQLMLIRKLYLDR